MAKGSFKTPANLFAWYLADPTRPALIGAIDGLTNGDQTLKYAAPWLQTGFPISEDLPLTEQTYNPRHRRERLPAAPGALDDSLQLASPIRTPNTAHSICVHCLVSPM